MSLSSPYCLYILYILRERGGQVSMASFRGFLSASSSWQVSLQGGVFHLPLEHPVLTRCRDILPQGKLPHSIINIRYLPQPLALLLDRVSHWTGSSLIWLYWLSGKVEHVQHGMTVDTGYLSKFRISFFFSPLLVLALQVCATILIFYVYGGYLNSAPHACTTRSLLTETSLWLLYYLYGFRYHSCSALWPMCSSSPSYKHYLYIDACHI